MELEHCHHKCADTRFTTPNYNITTTPRKEHGYVVRGEKCPDMGHERRIEKLEELLKLPIVVEANLSKHEVIAVVLYTGPMVR